MAILDEIEETKATQEHDVPSAEEIFRAELTNQIFAYLDEASREIKKIDYEMYDNFADATLVEIMPTVPAQWIDAKFENVLVEAGTVELWLLDATAAHVIHYKIADSKRTSADEFDGHLLVSGRTRLTRMHKFDDLMLKELIIAQVYLYLLHKYGYKSGEYWTI